MNTKFDFKPHDFFWLAGLLEGEAHFGRGVPTEPNNPRIALTMTDEDVIARVASLFSHRYTPVKPQPEHWQTTYRFTLRGLLAVRLMRQLQPLMSQRRQAQIQRALATYHYKPHPSITRQKISEEQVRAIKKRLAAGETAKSIAQDFPISHYAIWDIKSGKTWDHVSLEESQMEDMPDFEPVIALTRSAEHDFHWLAGLLEGEGSFIAGPPSAPNNPRISVAMTDEDVIARVAQICQTSYQALPSRHEKHKNVYRMLFRGQKAVDLMKQLRPLMGQRRQGQIDKALDTYVDIPQNQGMYNPAAKISEGQARAIKQRLRDGDKIAAIAEEFNVSLSLVREIKVGRTWKHITL